MSADSHPQTPQDREAEEGPRARQAIRAATKELMGERPVEQISVKEVLAAAGVSRNTFYKYYADKQALLNDVFDAELTHANWFDYGVSWPERHLWLFRHLLSDRQFYLNALKSPEFVAFWRELATRGNIGLLEAVTEGMEVNNSLLRHYARFMTSGVVDDVMDWLANPERISAEELAERHAAFVEYGLGGIVGRKGPELIGRGEQGVYVG